MRTAAELAKSIRQGELTAVEVAQETFSTIEHHDSQIQAFISLTRDLALERAEGIDQAIRLGSPVGPLAGVPVAIKDNLNLKGTHTTCGSRMLQNYRSPYTATVVDRLLSAGAIPVGKVNMDEFAMGSSTENSALKRTVNPWDHGRVPGGSSGGSAAAVAAGFTPISLGSDTGGSVRLPAAFTGTLALKPTYGRMSRYGLVAFASSLDQIGPFALSTEDLALVLDATSGRDPLDSTSLDVKPAFAAALGQDIKGMRFAYIKESLGAGNTPGVQAALDRTREVLESLGATLHEVSLPTLDYAIAAYYLICTSEASSNLARYDGMVYSGRLPAEEFNTSMSKSRGEFFGHEVKRRILMGTYALSSGYYDAFYAKAMRVRHLIAQDFARAFEQCDVLVTPTSPFPAFKFGEKSSDPVAMYQSDVDTVGVNLAGVPAISVPAGFETVDGKDLPIGIQFIAPALQDERLISVSDAFEKATGREYLKVAPR